MTRWKLGLVLALGGLLAACSSAKDDAALQAEKQKNLELQKRVNELESKAQPAPEIIASPITPTWEAELQPVPPAPAPRSAGRTRASASRSSHASAPAASAPAPAHRETTAPPPAHTTDSRPAAPPAASGSRNEPDRVSTSPEQAPGAGVWTDNPNLPHDQANRTEPVNRADQVTIPSGTQLALVLETPLSSATSHTGDHVTARVERATSDDGRVLLPGGTVLKGRVIEAIPSGRVKGKAHLSVAFDEIVVRGRTQPLATTKIEATAADSHERDAAVIGGGAAAGAIIGAITGGGNGAKKGAIIGGVAGTGAVLATRGKEVDLPSGSRWTVTVKGGVTF